MTAGGADRPAAVRAELVRHALRRMRPGCLRVECDDAGCRVALTMDASAAGRRNAAEKIVAYLRAAGLGLDAVDPVTALAAGPDPLRVLPAHTAGGR